MLVHPTATTPELSHLFERLLAAADADDDVAAVEEGLALVAPVVADDHAIVDREAVVLDSQRTGDARRLLSPGRRDPVGQRRDAEVGQTRDHDDALGARVFADGIVESTLEKPASLVLVELLSTVADDANPQSVHGILLWWLPDALSVPIRYRGRRVMSILSGMVYGDNMMYVFKKPDVCQVFFEYGVVARFRPFGLISISLHLWSELTSRHDHGYNTPRCRVCYSLGRGASPARLRSDR